MKSRFIYIIYFLFAATISFGQVVTLPDTNFRNCLVTRYKTVLNTSNQLVVSQAAALRGTLNCSSMKISNVEGLQYFSEISTLDLSTNSLNSLPNISTFKNLESIDVSENKLFVLPDMSKYPRLKRLYAQRNFLKAIPSLALNDSLQELYIHTNFLDTLPDLSNLKQLTLLNVVNNGLSYIPNIEKLISLQNLTCWQNKILSFPPLTNLEKLTTFDATNNLLKTIPVFSPNAKLKKVLLDQNLINTISTDFITDSLRVGKFSNNPLTFKELQKFTTKANYSVLVVNPQNLLQVGFSKSIREFEVLKIYTGIDKGVAGVSYDWYRNGVQLATVSNDTLIIPNISLSDSGKYTCQIKHPAFPNLSLQTDTFRVSIYPCFEMPNLSISSTDITCTQTGTLTVTGQNIPNDITFLLKSVASGKISKSTTGLFKALQDQRYSLSLQTKTGCTKVYAKEIAVAVQECKDFIVTPDNDGNMDSYFFAESGTVKIFDKMGYPVKEMKIPGEWDCMTTAGKVPVGYYIAYINEGQTRIGLTVMY